MDRPEGLWNDRDVIQLLLQEIKLERQSIGMWVSTFHTSQSFLFAAFALSSVGEHMYHQAIHWFSNYVVPAIGILFSLFLSLALAQGRARLSSLYACLRNRLNQMGGSATQEFAADLCLPSESDRRRGQLYAKWVPVICGFVWLFVGMHNVWYEFESKEARAHHNSSAGTAGTSLRHQNEKK